MRLRIRRSYKERRERRVEMAKWHSWFAWRPVLSSPDKTHLFWLEWVVRRDVGFRDSLYDDRRWEYRSNAEYIAEKLKEKK